LPGDGIINLVPGAEQTIGRGETCTYPIGSRKLSRQHARVFAGVGAWGVEDLNSTNGVRVNEEKVQIAWLKQGDVVRFGPIPFRFEVERPDLAGVPARPSAPQGAEGEHTMLFTSADGIRAADILIDADREAKKRTEEAPASIVPTTVAKKTVGAAVAPARSNHGRTIAIAAVAVAVVAALVAGGVVYYPTFQRDRDIAAIVDKETPVIARVISRVRDTTGTLPETARQEDIKALLPVISETGKAIGDGYADSRELADLYARSRFLVFEREFASLFTRPDPDGRFLQEAGLKAFDLRSRLDRIDAGLPPLPPGSDQDPLKAAADLAELSRILVAYRTFTRQFPQVGKTGLVPTPEQFNPVEDRKTDLNRYALAYHQVLTSDYRLLYNLINDVENRDLVLVNGWHQFLAPGQ
jgi:hypothetical protein